MDVKYVLKHDAVPTEEQLKEIRTAAEKNKDDIYELPEDQLAEIRRLASERNNKMRRRTVSLRIDEESIDIAKSIGENYTGIFRQILYHVLRDPELLKACLGNDTGI